MASESALIRAVSCRQYTSTLPRDVGRESSNCKMGVVAHGMRNVARDRNDLVENYKQTVRHKEKE